MIKAKYEESTTLIAQRKGLPSFIKNQVIVSNQDVELAKQCAPYIKQELRKLSENKIDVWIPYYDVIARALKSDKGTDLRHSNRIFTLLNMIPLVKCTNRQILSIGKNPGSIIATLEDLSHVLAITQNLTGLPAYKIKFFKEVFYPLWRAKTDPDKSADKTKEEDGISVTTKELKEKYKSKYGKITTTDNLKKTFLNELHNNGFIEEEISIINNKQYVYKPLVAGDDDNNEKISISFISNSGQFDNVLQHSRLLVPKNYILPPKNWLEMEILALKQYRIYETNSSDFIKLEDIHILNSVYDGDGNDSDSSRVPINEFITKYEHHVPLIRYVKSADFSNNHNKTDTNAENKATSDSKDVKAQRIDSNSISKISNNNNEPKLDKYSEEQPDFYTIGYGAHSIESFIDKVKGLNPRPRYLVDVRHSPYGSTRKPDFNQEPLKQSLNRWGINYMHKPELGVPSELRKDLGSPESYQKLWKWYDENNIPKLNSDSNTDLAYFMSQGKVVFMCVESDPLKCHRHRITEYFKSKGKKGLDI